MPSQKTAAATHRRAASPSARPTDTRAEMDAVMKKLGTLETELAALLERSLCETLQASGDVAGEVRKTVQQLVGSAFEAPRELSQELVQAGLRAADTGRTTAQDAAGTVREFGLIAREAARQLLRGSAEGLQEVRASHRRSAAA